MGKREKEKEEKIDDEDEDTDEVLDKYLSELHDGLYYELVPWPGPETREQLLSDLLEEVGDLARAVNRKDGRMYRYELLRVAAVALSMLWKYDEEAKKK